MPKVGMTMRSEFEREMSMGQMAGRPAWQRELTIEQKIQADQLANSVLATGSNEAVEQWWQFRAKHAALKEHEDKG